MHDALSYVLPVLYGNDFVIMREFRKIKAIENVHLEAGAHHANVRKSAESHSFGVFPSRWLKGER